MDKHKAPIAVDQAKCTPCKGLICVGVCPVGILEPAENKKPQVSDAAACTMCGVCVDLCPTKAITVNRPKSSK